MGTQKLDTVRKALETFIARTESFAVWLILPLTLLTFAVAVLRYAFDYGRIDLQEMSVYLHATILALCMAGVMKEDRHVRVDIFYRNMSPRHQAWVNCFGLLVLLMPFCITMLVLSFSYVTRSWSVLETSPEAGGLPLVFLLKSLLPLMAALLLLQSLASFIGNTGVLLKNR